MELAPNERIVGVDEFSTADSTLQGETSITITLSDKDGGTEVKGVQEALPPGVSIIDKEAGWRMALGTLAALIEAAGEPPNSPFSPASG